MNILQRAISKVTGFDKFLDLRLKQVSEAYVNTLEEPGFRKITERELKGLDMITRDKQLKIVFNLYLTNPFAKTIIDTINDFVFGDGFNYDVIAPDGTPKYKVEQSKKILDDFWNKNKLDLRLEKKGLDLSLNGMLIQPVFINEHGGEVRLGFVDPQNLDTVNADPMNIEEIQSVKLKGVMSGQPKTLEVIKINESNVQSESYGLLEGECFFFAINNVSNQPEGISDLLVSADTVDMLGQLLFNILKHSEMSYRTVEHVTLEGFSDEQINAWKSKNPRPKAGARYVTNEKVKIEEKTPDIKANNSAEIVRLFKNIVLLSKRLPEHWFADGGNTNLATAVEQGTAIFRMLKNRQQYWVYILEQILTFVLHQAYIKKKEGFNVTKEDLLNKLKVKIIVPEFETKNLEKVSDSINKIADFLDKAVTAGHMTKETAGKIYRGLCDLFGYDVDEKTESQKLAALETETE